jgi:hypothetical protein
METSPVNPLRKDHRPGYRFTATGTFGRLLTGTSVINAGDGGKALNPSLIAHIGPSLTFTIQGTVLAA